MHIQYSLVLSLTTIRWPLHLNVFDVFCSLNEVLQVPRDLYWILFIFQENFISNFNALKFNLGFLLEGEKQAEAEQDS